MNFAYKLAELREECNDYFDPREDDHITGWCEDCGAEVTSVTVDNGIGHYEYWGATGIHHQYDEVSPCCQGEVLESEPEMEAEAV